MDRFLASPLGRCLVLCLAAAIVLAFGYHLVHSLHQAGRSRASSSDMVHPSQPTADSPRPAR
jgi:hypothetical protein